MDSVEIIKKVSVIFFGCLFLLSIVLTVLLRLNSLILKYAHKRLSEEMEKLASVSYEETKDLVNERVWKRYRTNLAMFLSRQNFEESFCYNNTSYYLPNINVVFMNKTNSVMGTASFLKVPRTTPIYDLKVPFPEKTGERVIGISFETWLQDGSCITTQSKELSSDENGLSHESYESILTDHQNKIGEFPEVFLQPIKLDKEQYLKNLSSDESSDPRSSIEDNSEQTESDSDVAEDPEWEQLCLKAEKVIIETINSMDGDLKAEVSKLSICLLKNNQMGTDDKCVFGRYIGFQADRVGNTGEIHLYPESILAETEDLEDEVRITFLHEVGHHLGLDEDQVVARGL